MLAWVLHEQFLTHQAAGLSGRILTCVHGRLYLSISSPCLTLCVWGVAVWTSSFAAVPGLISGLVPSLASGTCSTCTLHGSYLVLRTRSSASQLGFRNAGVYLRHSEARSQGDDYSSTWERTVRTACHGKLWLACSPQFRTFHRHQLERVARMHLSRTGIWRSANQSSSLDLLFHLLVISSDSIAWSRGKEGLDSHRWPCCIDWSSFDWEVFHRISASEFWLGILPAHSSIACNLLWALSHRCFSLNQMTGLLTWWLGSDPGALSLSSAFRLRTTRSTMCLSSHLLTFNYCREGSASSND